MKRNIKNSNKVVDSILAHNLNFFQKTFTNEQEWIDYRLNPHPASEIRTLTLEAVVNSRGQLKNAQTPVVFNLN